MKQFQRFRQRMESNWEKLLMRYLLPGKLRILPQTLTIELTNRCSLACACCPNGCDHEHHRTHHTLTATEFKQLLEQIDVPVTRVFLHLHGEPFLVSDLPVIVGMLIERGIDDFSIFSNGYHIDLTLLDQLLDVTDSHKLDLCFSAELYSRQVYESIRCPGHFNAIWESMEQIDAVMARHQKDYSVNAIIDPQSIDTFKDTVPQIFQRLKQLKDIHFSSAFPWPHLPQTGDIAGHLGSRRSICSQTWQLPSILSSGEVTMCSSDFRGECVIGSLWEHRYSELINNPEARRFRRNIALRKPQRNQLCADCLIDRHQPLSRTVKRKFVEKAKEAQLEQFFAKFHSYYDLDHAQI